MWFSFRLLPLLFISGTSVLLSSSGLTVAVDDLFPRPLNYTLAATGETIQGALTGWGFHVSLSLNKGQGHCGEAGLSTTYGPDVGGSRTFEVQAFCVVNWVDESATRIKPRGAPAIVELNLTGTVAAIDDLAISNNATYFSWILSGTAISPADALGDAGLRTIDIVGFEALSLHALPPAPGCFYTPDMNGVGEFDLLFATKTGRKAHHPRFQLSQHRNAVATSITSMPG